MAFEVKLSCVAGKGDRGPWRENRAEMVITQSAHSFPQSRGDLTDAHISPKHSLCPSEFLSCWGLAGASQLEKQACRLWDPGRVGFSLPPHPRGTLENGLIVLLGFQSLMRHCRGQTQSLLYPLSFQSSPLWALRNRPAGVSSSLT